MAKANEHISVLKKEALEFLAISPTGFYADLTGGRGGHAEAIASQLNQGSGKLWVNDWDKEAYRFLKEHFKQNTQVEVGHLSFCDFLNDAENQDLLFDGLLADFGISSVQLDNPERGLSFQEDGPLDMRLDQRLTITAADVVNQFDNKSLADIFFHLGGERHAYKLASAIVNHRAKQKLTTTYELKELAQKVMGRFYRRQKIHPATRSFMALRIFINKELEQIEALLERFLGILKPGGRLVAISFHSLEDRLVKRRFFELAKLGKVSLPFKKPLVASEEEKKQNPRSRSAKMRVAVKV